VFLYVISILYWFFQIIEYALAAYVILMWLPFLPRLKPIMADIMNPLLRPVRQLLRRSVFNTRGIDISPVILYILASYGSQLCLALR
jgi:uncharacterized protein YggT (Ycf19 family)